MVFCLLLLGPKYIKCSIVRHGSGVKSKRIARQTGSSSRSSRSKKDFEDKEHSSDPIDGMIIRDRFLYYSLKDRPLTTTGFVLKLPKSRGIPEEVILKF
jgi:hypothetical protein